ncbi:hypothetical protein TSO5_03275 [Azospirillum sp. TSO5]|nr:hypothetical protein TSO5_03275 [Azospirillum sp. TSO5]
MPASPAPGEGVKDDAGKLEWSQIPPDAMAEIIKRYMLGAEKYGRGNWARGMAWSRIFDAMMRHAWAFWGGERDDPQDPGHHLAAAAWCAITLLTYDLRGLGTDDRGSPVVKVTP